MKEYFYNLRYKVDKTEWRARAKREFVFQLWEKYGSKDKGVTFLDFGCGTGVLQELFEKRFKGHGYGIDTSEKAIRYCKKRGLKRVKVFNGKKIPFEKDSFDLITAMDVLEHIKDDTNILKEFKRVLVKGGVAIILVPAHSRLWSSRDINLQHFRRYDSEELNNKCKKVGFKILTNKNVDFAVFFLFLLIHFLAPKKKGITQLKMDTASTNKFLNEIMFIYEQLENKFQNFATFPIGLSQAIVIRNENN